MCLCKPKQSKQHSLSQMECSHHECATPSMTSPSFLQLKTCAETGCRRDYDCSNDIALTATVLVAVAQPHCELLMFWHTFRS